MKVLLIAPQPFFEVRGTPLAILQLVKALSKLGYKVDIVTYHLGKNIKIKNVSIHRIINFPFIKNIPIGPSYTKLFLDFFIFLKAFQMCIKNHYDVVHAVEEAVFSGIVIKKIFHSPIIYDMDSSISQQLINSGFIKNKYFLKLVCSLENWAIDNSNSVLTVCSSLTEIVYNKFPQKKVFQLEDIPPGDGQIEVSKEKISELKRKLNLTEKMIILYTGNFESYQGIDLLIKSIPEVTKYKPDVKFLLVGGEKENIIIMKRLANYLKVEDFIIFTGKEPMEKIPAYMALTDILVSPRCKGTNTPFKIFTYLQSGKPIVATNLPAHTQVLNEKISVLVEPTPKGIAGGIISLLKDEELKDKIGRKGKIFVEENYSYKKFVKKVKEVYDSLES
ncbi:glycosyltransferase family 4 protein [Candidatus Aerophobetes bacterium]|nr:glycosyltransferase family 4 protein [Candidatus Aerophobetes bacterium]